MKSIFILFALLSILNNCYCQSSDSTLPIKIGLRLLKSDTLTINKNRWANAIKRNTYEIKTNSVKLKTFDIEISLENISKDSIIVWLMSCSWEDGFEMNNDYMYLRTGRNGCDMNSLMPYYIKAGERMTFSATLEKSIKFDYPCQGCIYGYQTLTTKLGLIVTNVRYNPKLNISTQNVFYPVDKSLWKIVWSNPLYLFGEQFEPKPISVYNR